MSDNTASRVFVGASLFQNVVARTSRTLCGPCGSYPL